MESIESDVRICNGETSRAEYKAAIDFRKKGWGGSVDGKAKVYESIHCLNAKVYESIHCLNEKFYESFHCLCHAHFDDWNRKRQLSVPLCGVYAFLYVFLYAFLYAFSLAKLASIYFDQLPLSQMLGPTFSFLFPPLLARNHLHFQNRAD